MADGAVVSQGLAETVADGNDDDAMLREVVEGLQRTDKRISSKFHYDKRGSELFEQITELEEYYPTRTERALLEAWMPVWVPQLRPAALVELGAGSAEKTRIVLDAMRWAGSGRAYVPVDVSHDFLQATASQLREEYPEIDVQPVVADMSSQLSLPADLPVPRWIAFLGSTLGNFEADGAVDLLRRIRRRLTDGDRFLLGVDLRPGPHKSVERIERAYNDARGVTAAFSLNVLAVLNAEVGADFDLTGFRHRSFYNEGEGRIETYLDSLRDQVITFPDGTEIPFRAGESVRTEISCKYDRPTIDDFFARASMVVDRWVEDSCGYYALVLGAAAP